MVLRGRYKRAKLDCLAPAQSVGPGASPVGLGEGAKPDAPALITAIKKNGGPKRTAILVTGRAAYSIYPSA